MKRVHYGYLANRAVPLLAGGVPSADRGVGQPAGATREAAAQRDSRTEDGTHPRRCVAIRRALNKDVNPKRTTLADVAAAAGVSLTTASVVLAGRPEGLRQFRSSTIDRVREQAERLGYQTNLFASSLSGKASAFFALVIHDVGNGGPMPPSQEPGIRWYYWAFEGSLLAGVIQAARTTSLHPIIATCGPDADPPSIQSVRRIISGGVCGTIARTPPPPLESYLRQKWRQGHRLVVVFPEQFASWPSNALDVDNRAIGQIAALLLYRQGRRRWGLVRPPHHSASLSHRCEVFQAMAHELGLEVHTVELPAHLPEGFAATSVAHNLRQLKLDGLFSLNCVASVSALLGCMQNGIKPGIDVSLVGCDSSLWQSSPLPRITSVDISWKAVGITALAKLSAMVETGETQFDNVLLQPQITPAESCPVPSDMLAGQDPCDWESRTAQ